MADQCVTYHCPSLLSVLPLFVPCSSIPPRFCVLWTRHSRTPSNVRWSLFLGVFAFLAALGTNILVVE